MSSKSVDDESSCLKWCDILCCPPLPSVIVSKLAFKPPTVTTYELIPTESESIQYVFQLSPEIDQTSLRRLIQQDARFVKTARGNNIVVIYLKCTKKKNFTILYSHGSTVDVGYMHRFCADLSLMTGCDVVTYDYSGYGQSTGKPTEMDMYADIRSAWDYILAAQEPDRQKVILYGQDIGTVPTIDLASKVQCAGVIIQSPLMSVRRQIFPGFNWCRFLDCMNSIEKIPKVTAPVLVIHGTNDKVIDFSHGQAIHESCPRAVEPLWIEGAGHDDIELHQQYIARLRKFINEELSS